MTTIQPLSTRREYPLTPDPDTFVFLQDWRGLDESALNGGAPMSHHGDGTPSGAVDIMRETIGGKEVHWVQLKPEVKTYGTLVIPQLDALNPLQANPTGVTFELLWGEDVEWANVPNFAGVFGYGDTEGGWQNFRLDCFFFKGRLQCKVAHRQGTNSTTPYVAVAQSAPGLFPIGGFHHIAVSIDGDGNMTVWVDGVPGVPALIPAWDSVIATQGGRNSFVIGGDDPQDCRYGWRCASVKISWNARGASAIEVPDREKIVISSDGFDLMPLGRLHGVPGHVRPSVHPLPILRVDKITSGLTISETQSAATPIAGASGKYFYNFWILDGYFQKQWKEGAWQVCLGVGSCPQLLGGSVAPFTSSEAKPIWNPIGKPFAPEVPNDFNAYATIVSDIYHYMRYTLGVPVSYVDAWNEGNLLAGNPPVGYFWKGTPEQYFAMHEAAFAAIEAVDRNRGEAHPKFIWFSDAGFDPTPNSVRRTDIWYNALVKHLVAAGRKEDSIGVGLHAYDGALSTLAGWVTYVESLFESNGLVPPVLYNTESSPADSHASVKYVPWKTFPEIHDGPFGAAQLLKQLDFESRSWFEMHVLASQQREKGGFRLFNDDGTPNGMYTVAVFYNEIQSGHPVVVDIQGSPSLGAFASLDDDGAVELLVYDCNWCGAARSIDLYFGDEVVTVDLDEGPGAYGHRIERGTTPPDPEPAPVGPTATISGEVSLPNGEKYAFGPVAVALKGVPS